MEAVRKSLFQNDDRELLEAVVNKKPRTPPFLLFTQLAGVAEMVALVEAGSGHPKLALVAALVGLGRAAAGEGRGAAALARRDHAS